LAIRILIANEGWNTRFQLTIDYDETVLNYGWHPNGAPWEVEGHEAGAGGRTTLMLRRAPGRSEPPRPWGDETTAIQLIFTLRDPLPTERLPFLVRTELSLDPDESFFFFGETQRPRKTQLHSGTATIYYRSGVEVGSGSITRRKQDFSLPLYLTYLGANADDNAPAERVFPVGLHYDEVFLELLSVDAVDGTTVGDPGAVLLPESDAPTEMFRVGIPADWETSACRRHVANLHFRYTGEPLDPATPDGPVDKIPVSASFLPDASPNPVVHGDGFGASDGPPGGIKFMADYFVRGNTDSRSVGPQIALVDAVRILNGFFQDQPLPCADAADVNNNGSIDITDAIHIINFLYRSGLPPAPPFPDLGLDDAGLPPKDTLGCDKPVPVFRAE